jgi:hypothetical protein
VQTGAGADASVSPVASAGCRAQLNGIVGVLDHLRRNLTVGLSYDAYLEEVEAAKTAYGGIAVESLPLGCLTLVGNPAERALNEYIAGVNTWGDCLAVAGCEPASIEAELKRGWQVASARVSVAQAGFGELRSAQSRQG